MKVSVNLAHLALMKYGEDVFDDNFEIVFDSKETDIKKINPNEFGSLRELIALDLEGKRQVLSMGAVLLENDANFFDELIKHYRGGE